MSAARDIVNIGKGLCRIKVRSAHLRGKLAAMPEVVFSGDRAVFPHWMRPNVERLISRPNRKRPRPDASQIELALKL